jgi:hypothetical protein
MSDVQRKSLLALKAKTGLMVLSTDKVNATAVLNIVDCNLKREGIHN